MSDLASSSSTVRLILGLARPHRGRLAIVLAAMSVETLMALAAPWPLKIVLDEPARAALAAAGVVAIALVGGLASFVDNYVTERVGQGIANDLRLRVYTHLECLSFSYFDTHQTGALLGTITEDVETVQDFVSASLLAIVIDVTTIAGMLAVMFWLNWQFSLIVLAMTPLLLWFVMRFKRAVKQATRELRLRETDIVSVVQTGLESIRTVQAFGARDVEVARLAAASQATVDAALAARRVKSLLPPVIDVAVAGGTAIVLWRGAALTISGAMTIGSLVVFLAYLAKFFKPVQDLAKMTNAVAQANVALERITGILDIEIGVRERPRARVPDTFTGAIAFEHVAFSYVPDRPVLRDVTFSIAPGQFVGVVGGTGSGKSTILSLIPRFYDPSAGRVLIDGGDIRELSLDGLRRQIAFVLQDTVLFHGSVRDNIAYGRVRATDDEIVAAATLANAHEFITAMPGGYGASVGERGVTLSGGQRQRIGIARAFIRNAPILVLDEPTASLDAESEQLVLEGLSRLTKGRTVVMITHRLGALRDAGRILVVHGGVIAEDGTHAQLLALNGVYAGLFAAQTGTSSAWHAN